MDGDSIPPLASKSQLRAYYSLLVTGSALHLFLFIFTLSSRNVKKHAVVLNFYFIFCVTLWMDAVLLWTGHIYDPDPPTGLEITNAVSRLPGMVMNASTTLMVVMKFWVSTNIALSTRVSHYFYWADSRVLVMIPYLLGIPFVIAFLVETITHSSILIRTPLYASIRPPNKLLYASVSVSLVLMVLVLVVAVWLTFLLCRMRAAQRGLLQTSWTVNIQLAARLLLFLFYSFISIALHIKTLAPGTHNEARNEELFGSIGIIAFALFFIQADILEALGMGVRLRRSSLPHISQIKTEELSQLHLPRKPEMCAKGSSDKDYSLIESQSYSQSHSQSQSQSHRNLSLPSNQSQHIA
ncbi:hypothetical protein E3P81_03597 [Wallemia ichthyophaga]|nr:hypothetical protein E3P97_02364 [Wallemia ichthyophaga]TIB28856.1 hypothetical protein E3P85_03464 [Wallemia ichthyophaga]TIB44242.1 hypothetical protein E3P82_03602 [Wallemia ichthyophaga]TIB46619.1 hypothetical protein E3P81_03597 [Wallemia ichthyophaga]TIB49241.1 hypothetical protein E3P80_03606 [Wallemia ichthyophaga]